MKKRNTYTVLFTLITLMSFHVSAQNVNIPDANFKAYLVGNTAINTNADTEIQVTEAAAFAGNLFCTNLGITDLTGLEAFTALDGLYVRDNNLGSLDVSANTALTFIDCKNTGINALDVSNNTALAGMECSVNNLTALDLSNNPALTSLNCGINDLTSLNLTNCTLLSNFTCDDNDLVSLDVTNCAALSYFVCNFNNFGNLDLSNCPNLSYLGCTGANLTSLDVSNNTALATLFCALNDISILDLGANTSLVFLNCTDNDLSVLNVANGNNTNVSTFAATGNPNLTCIQVDDDVWSTSNWTSIDATASFSTDCNYSLGIDEENLSKNILLYPNPAIDQIYVVTDEIIESIVIVGVTGKSSELTLVNDSIDVSHLRSGIYFLRVKTNEGISSKKFIKE